MNIYRFLLVLIAIYIFPTNGKNILALLITLSPSHLIIDMAVVRALVECGHNVTVVTTLPLNEQVKDFEHIYLHPDTMVPLQFHKMVKTFQEPNSIYKSLFLSATIKEVSITLSDVLMNWKFQDLLNGDNHYDLVLIGYIFTDYLFGVAAHFQCPIALLWPNQPFVSLSQLIGNPIEPAYIPHPMVEGFISITFLARMKNLIAHGLQRISDVHMQLWMQEIYKKHFPAEKYPSLKEMQQNVSLVLFTHHFSEGPVRPLVPGFVEIGGIQLKEKPDPLPKDIDDFLRDSSGSGAIFFSLGSNVRKEHVGNKTLNIILNVLSKMPQNILWKWDDDYFPGNISNILFRKWLPQDDILAHRQIRLFITHGGKGSITESQYHGVPMVGIPVFGDQPNNIEAMIAKGFGLGVDYKSITEDSFRNVIKEVLQNSKYSSKVKQFSKVFKDRPMTPKQTAVFWLEYVMRHKGAPHMQSTLKRMTFIEEHSIDVLLVLIALAYIFWRLLKMVISKLFSFGNISNRKINRKVD